MACDPAPFGKPVGFFQFLGDPIGGIVLGIANAVMSAAISLYGDLMASIPTVNVDSGSAREISTQTQWIVVYAAVASLVVAATRMALERRSEAGQTALKGLVRVILVSGAATAVVAAIARLSDNYADFLFQVAGQEQVSNIGCGGSVDIPPFMLLLLAFLLLIAGVVQTILLYIRLGVMIVLLGTLPLAASASMTDWGSGWWRKHVGWMIAWLLYKPAAGLVIYAGTVMISANGPTGASERIAGVGVLLLSAIALPALLKLIVPATAALGGAGAMRQGTMAAAGGLASGAKSLAASAPSMGQGGGSPSGPPGASGAAGGQGPAGGRGLAASGGAAGGGGAAGAAAAAGPAGAALGAAVSIAQGVGRVAGGALDGADGNAGHNR
ncbi:hypothetical protein [Streptomyces bauhiniae]